MGLKCTMAGSGLAVSVGSRDAVRALSPSSMLVILRRALPRGSRVAQQLQAPSLRPRGFTVGPRNWVTGPSLTSHCEGGRSL